MPWWGWLVISLLGAALITLTGIAAYREYLRS